MRRRIHLGIAALTLVSVGACSRGQEARSVPQRTLAPEQGSVTSPTTQAQGQETLLEVVPPGTPNVARLKVADAAAQPLFQGFLAELREMPQMAQRTALIEQRCGENPLEAVDEVILFGGAKEPQQRGTQPRQGTQQRPGGQPPSAQQPQATQPQATQPQATQPQPGAQQQQRGQQQRQQQQAGMGARVRQGDMLVQLRQPTEWAFQCLTAMRSDARETWIRGRQARRVGNFVVVDAGQQRLLVTSHERAAGALQRLAQAERTTQTHGAAQQAERLGDPLLFSTGEFANRLGLESAEAVVTQQGEALQVRVTGDMQDEQAAASTVGRLQQGLRVARALIGDGTQQGQPQGETQAPEGQQGAADDPEGAELTLGDDQNDPEKLRSLVDSVNIQQRGDVVSVSLDMPDAETQKFVGEALGRFLAEGGPQRIQQQQQQRNQQQGSTPSPGGSTPSPGGGTTSPGGGTPSPGGGTTSPGGGTPSPGGGTTSPGGGTPSPGGGTTSPGGGTGPSDM